MHPYLFISLPPLSPMTFDTRIVLFLLAAALLLLAPPASVAQTEPAASTLPIQTQPVPTLAVPTQPVPNLPVDVPLIAEALTLDGRLDEPFWQRAAIRELGYEISPGENTPAPVRTRAYLIDSGRSLRIAFRAEDPDPSKIVAVLRDRDSAAQDDFVGLRLDTFDTQQLAYEFFVSAAGVQMDLTYNGANGNEDEAWDTLWESAVSVDEGGYTVELEIPYASLRFPHSEASKQWNVQFLRIRPRESRFVYASNAEDRNISCVLCQQTKLVGFESADPGRNLLLNPTLTAGSAQSRSGPGESRQSAGSKVEFGMDATWSPTPNNVLGATFNPDFSQIEIDGAQLDVNNSFALFFPERRPFFLDSADFFSTPSELVYTRNVADPDYGARFTGRSGQHTYGFFGASDEQTNVLRPGAFASRLGQIEGDSTDFVGTYRYALDASSNLGGLITQRSADGYDNTLVNVDGKWQRGGHTLLTQFMRSETEDAEGYRSQPFGGNAHLLNYEYRDRKKTFSIGKRRHDPGFRADMGFIGQVDFDRWVVGGSYRWYPQDHFFNEVRINGDWDRTVQLSAERRIEREVEAYLSADGRMQSYLQIGGGKRMRFWNGVDYPETFYTFYGEVRPLKNWQFSMFYRGGDQIDFRNSALGRIRAFEPSATVNLFARASLQLSYIDQSLQRDGGQVFHARLADARLSWQFNLRQRLRLAVQAGRTDFDPLLNQGPGQALGPAQVSDTGTQLVYSYKFNPRTVFYAGYSDSYIGSDSVENYQTGRSLFLKFGYGWQP